MANRLTDDNNVITIDLSPMLESNEDYVRDPSLETECQAHDQVFRWKHDDINTKMDSYLNQETTAFQRVEDEVRLLLHGQWQTRTECWSNIKDPVDISGIPSLQRILLIRDITKRLREVDDTREILTGKAFTVKLDSTKFSIRLQPYNNQPGNGFLTMKGSRRMYEDSHWKMEKYHQCFKKIRANEIDSVVTRARRRGTQIALKDLEDLESVRKEKKDVKKEMAEELTYFMLKYDWEIACRLQRPFINYSHFYDVLPFGIGIALMHCINS